MILPDDDMEARIKRLSADVDKALADCVASSTDGDVVVSYIVVIVADDRAGDLKGDLAEGRRGPDGYPARCPDGAPREHAPQSDGWTAPCRLRDRHRPPPG